MTTPGNALQVAIYTRLTDQLSGVAVYDHVPVTNSFPYVVIGEETSLPWDAKTGLEGWEMTLTFHVWDQPKAGRKSVKTVLGSIYDALHHQETNITPTGFTVILCRLDQDLGVMQEIAEGDSDHYYHGIQRYRILIQTTS